MKFSIIIPFRNKESSRVQRCLDSLREQTVKDFEVCFIDFGSDIHAAKEIESLCQNYAFVNYIYSHTQGWFWSRSHALNTGIRHAQGDYVVTVDIDMIYSSNFIEIISERVQKNKLIHYHCYYLPENFKNYDKLRDLDLKGLELSNPDSAKGLFVVEKSILEQIQGFDQFYKIWGIEDMDMSRRLAYFGIKIEWLPPKKSPIFHQWHPVAHGDRRTPKGWQQTCVNHYHAKTKEDIVCPNPDWGKLLSEDERPILDLIRVQSNKIFTFERPIESAYNSFFLLFSKLQEGEVLSINQSFGIISPTESPSLLARFFNTINNLLSKTPLSYRITDLAGHEREIIDFHSTRDFLFYFLHPNRNLFSDYYWDVQKPSIKLWILK
jgi:glycosyltransferase involved in cell wall biosynthesis